MLALESSLDGCAGRLVPVELTLDMLPSLCLPVDTGVVGESVVEGWC